MSAGTLSRRMRARAFAKINLSLRVLGLRPDGYHELRTVFQSLALHDTLTFEPAAGFALECDDPACPADDTNLVWRAAEAVWRAAGRRGMPRGVRVRIAKRVPMQAGLGGGSSDAAAALRGFARIWDVREEALRDVAAGLGADVSFFLLGGTALGVGRGEVLFPLIDVPSAWVVIVLPNFGVSTRDAYAWFDSVHSGSGAIFRNCTPAARPRRVAISENRSRPRMPEMGNDLEGPVVERHPAIRRLMRSLERAGALHAAMSGSGSAVFGLFESRQTAERAAQGLNARNRRTVLTRTLTHRRVASLSEPI